MEPEQERMGDLIAEAREAVFEAVLEWYKNPFDDDAVNTLFALIDDWQRLRGNVYD